MTTADALPRRSAEQFAEKQPALLPPALTAQVTRDPMDSMVQTARDLTAAALARRDDGSDRSRGVSVKGSPKGCALQIVMLDAAQLLGIRKTVSVECNGS